MKKFFALAAIAAMICGINSCTPKEEPVYEIQVQLVNDGSPFAISSKTVNLTDGIADFNAETDENGIATFLVNAGSYTATTSFSYDMGVYNGTNANVIVSSTNTSFELPLVKSKGSQIIIKEFYFAYCPDDSGESYYGGDPYVTLYNNSPFEVDASNVIITTLVPYNATGTLTYLQPDGSFSFEAQNYLPAGSGLWWFNDEVKIAPYSEITIAIFGAIDHTATYHNSVDLSKPEYYWMNGAEVKSFGNAKYVVSDNIAKSHYLDGYCIAMTPSKSWALDAVSPTIYIAALPPATRQALIDDTSGYDLSLGAMFKAIKMPIDCVLDAVEIWPASTSATCLHRFPATVNTGHLAFTDKLGHTAYRNVNKEATEALPENAGKLVYNYEGAADPESSDDPSKIDAEASIKAGAHIVFSDTNNSANDFHERKVSALKK